MRRMRPAARECLQQEVCAGDLILLCDERAAVEAGQRARICEARNRRIGTGSHGTLIGTHSARCIPGVYTPTVCAGTDGSIMC